MSEGDNIDQRTVKSFGNEWSRFDQAEMSGAEARKVFDEYFAVFPWDSLCEKSEGFDMGCGSGRWARFVAPRVGLLHCVDPSTAISIAIKNLSEFDNVKFHHSSVSMSGIPPSSQDFGYSLGVLHHVPDTREAIRSCADLLKPGAPLLLYLYYALDNRPFWFRAIWKASDCLRGLVFRLPNQLKELVTDCLALILYLPLARFSGLLERSGISVSGIPLSYYRSHTFYTMRTDARDRFGTPLEQRFTRGQISQMMIEAGLCNLRFSDSAPFWCVVGYRNKTWEQTL